MGSVRVIASTLGSSSHRRQWTSTRRKVSGTFEFLFIRIAVFTSFTWQIVQFSLFSHYFLFGSSFLCLVGASYND